ncbi:hypothetical protein [Rheinheimera texasensis]|jgi:hypothetical protein|uniref:hypothetical protein n=1 Tax=Rheinheimera texasensis TaxID=306205 RepID=UPI0032B29F36
MKFVLSRAGITLLVLILILSGCLYLFYTTGVTGGRTGQDAVRDETPVKYYFYMILYTSGLLCVCCAYVYLIFNPPELSKKKKIEENEDDE